MPLVDYGEIEHILKALAYYIFILKWIIDGFVKRIWNIHDLNIHCSAMFHIKREHPSLFRYKKIFCENITGS